MSAEQTKQTELDLSAWKNEKCPHCGSIVWVKLHRSLWQKLLRWKENLCYCRECQNQFWKKRES